MAAIEEHVKFFKMHLKMLPHPYASQDANKLMLIFFSVCGLEILGALDELYPKGSDKRAKLIDFIYTFQLCGAGGEGGGVGGFRGSAAGAAALDSSHVTMTQCAVLLLSVLGDPLERVRKAAVLATVGRLQRADGSIESVAFVPEQARESQEADMRFVYSACVVCRVLGDDWSTVDRAAMARFIERSQTYEGGFAQAPGQEAHGGSTFCAVASLALMGSLDQVLTADRRRRLVRWLVQRQQARGLNGRENKKVSGADAAAQAGFVDYIPQTNLHHNHHPHHTD